MALRIHLLIRNDEKTLEDSLRSILPLNSEIIIGNFGSSDRSKAICKSFGLAPVHMNPELDLDQIRNSLLGDDWNLYIHPWEVLASGHNDILKKIESNNNTAYQLQIFQGNIVSYEIRLFRKLSFQNPVFETILISSAEALCSVVYSRQAPSLITDQTINRLQKWKSSGSIEPYYYEAFALLSQGKEIRRFHSNG